MITITKTPDKYLLSALKPIEFAISMNEVVASGVRFLVEIWKYVDGASGDVKITSFSKIPMPSGPNSIANIQIDSILVDYCQVVNLPSYLSIQPAESQAAVLKFYVKFFRLENGVTSQQQTTSTYAVWKGRLLRNDNILLNGAKKIINNLTPVFFSYLVENQNNVSKIVRLKYNVVLKNGTVITNQLLYSSAYTQNTIITYPIWAKYINSNPINYFDVWVEELISGDIIKQSEPYRFELFDTRTSDNFIFLNSGGAFETICINSILESEHQYVREEIKIKPIGNIRNQKTVFVDKSENFTAVTRSINDFERDCMIDFFDSQEVWLDLAKGFGYYVPINYTSNQYKMWRKNLITYLSFSFLLACDTIEDPKLLNILVNCVKINTTKLYLDKSPNYGAYELPTDIVHIKVTNITQGNIVIDELTTTRGDLSDIYTGTFGNNNDNVKVEIWTTDAFGRISDTLSFNTSLYAFTPFICTTPVPSFSNITFTAGKYYITITWPSDSGQCGDFPDDILYLEIQNLANGQWYAFTTSTDDDDKILANREAGTYTGYLMLRGGNPDGSGITINTNDNLRGWIWSSRASSPGVFETKFGYFFAAFII